MAGIARTEFLPFSLRSTGTRRCVFAKLLLLNAFWLLQSTPTAIGGTSVVVSTGAASPDGNGLLSTFNAPSINSAGQIAFVSQLTGTGGGTADNQALFRLDTGGITHIARKGQVINSRSVTLLFSPYLDSSGVVCGVPALGSPATFTHFFSTGGPLSLMYTPGTSSPTGNNTLIGVTTATVNDAGVGAYVAAYSGGNPELGIYERAVNGVITTRLLRGSAAPRGGSITGIASRLTMNESAQVANVLSIDGTATKSVARIDGTTVHELARTGDLALDGISTIGSPSSTSSFTTEPIPIINDAGQVAFPAPYTQPASRLGVFLADDTGVRLVAPGNLPEGNTTTMNVVGLSAAGKVAFTTEFFGGSDPISGIYLADASSRSLIALEDTATPVPGKYFRTFFSTATTLNSAGQLAFLAELSDTVNGPAAGRGLFFYDPTTGLQQIARTGDTLAGSSITNIYFNGTVLNSISVQSPDTSLSGLNSAGKVAFGFDLANSQSGVAVWSATNIPGDYNGDTIVDAQDYNVWRSAYGTNQVGADGNKNGAVDTGDYVIWRKALAQAAARAESHLSGNLSEAVPEPTAFHLSVGLALLFVRRPVYKRAIQGG
jgi:hypothetical protein